MRDLNSRLDWKEDAGKLKARVRPVPAAALRVGGTLAAAIAFFILAICLESRLSQLLFIPLQLAATLGLALAFRLFFYYQATEFSLEADHQSLRLRYRLFGYRREFPASALTPVGLAEEEGSPLAGVNMGPLGGSLWAEADGRYVCFGRGLNETDARLLAKMINSALGKTEARDD